MKLSEAIRLGSLFGPQGFGARSFVCDVSPCALGAARMALGIPAIDAAYGILRERFALLNTYTSNPSGNGWKSGNDVLGMIYHLNDYCKWSREQIADWVASIEPEEEIEPAHLALPELAQSI